MAVDVLVLPGHGLKFLGLHTRIDGMIDHHAHCCGAVADGCCAAPLSVADLVPVLFERMLDAHQTGFAFGEVLTHANYMVGRGEPIHEIGKDWVHR